MALYHETLDGFTEWKLEPLGDDLVRWPPNIERLWTDEALAAIGLYRPGPPEPVPDGKRVVSSSVQRVGGVVRWVHSLEDIPIEDLRAEFLARLASRRWEVETGGVTVGEITVPSDRETQSRIAQIVAAYDKGFLTGPVLFKFAAGVHADVDEATIRAAMEAGAQLIQTCFRREGELAAEIMAASSIAELLAVDIETFWP